MRKMRHRCFGFVLCVALTLGITGCGLHLIGTPADRPSSLARMHFTSDNPNNRLTGVVKRSLIARDIVLTDKAPLILSLSKIKYTHPFPSELNAGVAFTTTATLSATFELLTRSGKTVVGPARISANESLFHNANQINTTSMDALFERLLTARLAAQLFDVLRSAHTQALIAKAHKGDKHATSRQ